jgi:hypothetical protein
MAGRDWRALTGQFESILESVLKPQRLPGRDSRGFLG